MGVSIDRFDHGASDASSERRKPAASGTRSSSASRRSTRRTTSRSRDQRPAVGVLHMALDRGQPGGHRLQHGIRRRRARLRRLPPRRKRRSRTRSPICPTCSRRRTAATASTACAGLIAQEIAHIYGLDHEYSFVDGNSSACNDPMTYRDDCGGQKFFRNQRGAVRRVRPARPGCGPSTTAASAQNSHAQAARACSARARRPRRRRGSVITSRRRAPRSRATVRSRRSRPRSAASRRSSCGSTATSGRRSQGRRVRTERPAEHRRTRSPLPSQRARRRPGHRHEGVRRHRRRGLTRRPSTVTKGAPCADAIDLRRRARSATPASASGIRRPACSATNAPIRSSASSGMCEGTADTQICTPGVRRRVRRG